MRHTVDEKIVLRLAGVRKGENMTDIKKRSVAFAIILSIVTCGIYAIYWQVCLVNDMNKVSKKENAKGGVVVFLLSLITCSIYWLYWLFKAGENMDAAKTANGAPTSSRGLVYLLLSIFGLGIVAVAILQSDLNSLAAELGAPVADSVSEPEKTPEALEEKHDDSEM